MLVVLPLVELVAHIFICLDSIIITYFCMLLILSSSLTLLTNPRILKCQHVAQHHSVLTPQTEIVKKSFFKYQKGIDLCRQITHGFLQVKTIENTPISWFPMFCSKLVTSKSCVFINLLFPKCCGCYCLINKKTKTSSCPKINVVLREAQQIKLKMWYLRTSLGIFKKNIFLVSFFCMLVFVNI